MSQSFYSFDWVSSKQSLEQFQRQKSQRKKLIVVEEIDRM